MMQHIGDITKIDGATIEPVWCVTGGSPCQDLSIAGKRAGLAGARSGLFMEQIRVIKEMREHDKQLGWAGELIRPRYMVWENVPGALSSNKGRDFAAVLEETIRIVEPEAPGIEVPEKGWPTWGGYRDVDGRWSVAWRVHDAQYWGVPQRRRRIALVADFGGDTAHEILFERTGVSGDLEPRSEAGERPAGNAESGVNPAVARSLTARADGSPCIDRGPNIVVAPVAADLYTATITGDIAATVAARTGQYGDASGPSVLCAGFKLGNSEQARSIGYQEELSPTLNAECGGNKPTVVAPVAYGICSYTSNSMMSGNPHSWIYEADTSRTLDLNGGNPACNQGGIAVVQMAYQMQGFGDYREADVASSCKQRDYKDSTDLVIGIDGECNAYIEQYGTLRAHASGGAEETLMHRMAVRRLTPLECERLQGFPDGWTDIGDYTDSTGKKRKTSDSARYKALGNSIALPFWRWMFGRMAAYLPEGATLGSLFDGIGGFPLCWEDVHGAGTAVWASEIEEFPIAVTKKRFGSENMIHYTLNIEPPVEPPAYTCPICPVCGAETDTVYKNVYGDPVGCPECVTEVDAWTL
jgi:DNA (cytosine-5)-methyltransferase 1